MFIIKEPLDNYCDSWCFVGSRVTCNPAPLDTDCDVLCLTEDDYTNDRFVAWLEDTGWSLDEGYETIDHFDSWKKTIDTTPYNIILTQSGKWYDTFIRATMECKKKNLLKKKDRISKFNHIFRKAKKGIAASQLQPAVGLNPNDQVGNIWNLFNTTPYNSNSIWSLYETTS